MMHLRSVSLWDMLEVNGRHFADVVMGIKRAQSIIEHVGTAEAVASPIAPESTAQVSSHLGEIIAAAESLRARLTSVRAARAKWNVDNKPGFTWGEFKRALDDIEDRLKDELDLLKFFALDQNESALLAQGADLIGQGAANALPSVIFEMEEAAKCLALARPTASAFHAMRALEVGIRALARFLEIEDPLKPAERNWAIVLKKIKEQMDAKYPSTARIAGFEGSEVEALYASLDAIKNPWRNSTMHNETIYQPHEATHILQATNAFLNRLSNLCNQNGERVNQGMAALIAGFLTSDLGEV